jgi:hypothetical protein
MALKIRLKRPTGLHPSASVLLRVALVGGAVVALAVFAVFGFYYVKYQGVVDKRLTQPLFANCSSASCARPATLLTEPRKLRRWAHSARAL